MSLELLDIGEVADDRTGENLRSAGAKLNNLINETITIESSQQVIRGDVDANASATLTLQSDLSVVETQVDENTTQITIHGTSIATLETDVSVNTDDIDANTTSTVSLRNDLDITITYVDGVPEQVDANLTSIAEIESNIDLIIGDADIESTSLLTLQNEVDATVDYVDGVPELASVNASSIATLQTDVSVNTDDIDANTSATISLDSRATVNEGEVTDLWSEMSLRVEANDIVAEINLSADVIDGANIHVTGDTVFDDDVQVRGDVTARSFTAEGDGDIEFTMGSRGFTYQEASFGKVGEQIVYAGNLAKGDSDNLYDRRAPFRAFSFEVQVLARQPSGSGCFSGRWNVAVRTDVDGLANWSTTLYDEQTTGYTGDVPTLTVVSDGSGDTGRFRLRLANPALANQTINYAAYVNELDRQ